MGKIITFTGAMGAGKDTIARLLGFPYVTSTTTRPPRTTDRPGEYEQISRDEFDRLEDAGTFAWSQPIAEHLYGTKLEYLKAAQEVLHPSIMILVPERVRTLREFVPAELITSFYIVSPDLAVQRTRLEQRGDHPDKIEQRLPERNWDAEARQSNLPYIFITNNGTIDEAVEQVKRYLK